MNKKIYANDLVPAEAFHPGEIIKDELGARDITQKDFAGKMGIRPNVLSEIITGKRNITPVIAIKLEIAFDFDIKAELWMRLQVGYEIDKIRIKHRNALLKSKIPTKRKKGFENIKIWKQEKRN